MHIPRGIASTASDLGLVTDVSGRPQLIRLSTGEHLASAQQSAQPIAIVGGVAISWRCEDGALRIISSSPEAGSLKTVWATRIPLPEWVTEDSCKQTGDGRERVGLNVSTQVVSGELQVYWSAHPFYRGGAAPTDVVMESTEQRSYGDARIALDDGTLLGEHAPESPPQTDARSPVRPPPGRKLHSYLRGAYLETVPWQRGSNDYYLTRPAAGSGIALHRRHPQGEEVQEIFADGYAEASVSEDGRLLFVRPAQTRAPWFVFDVETREKIGLVPYDSHTVELTAVGDRALVLVEETAAGEKRLELRCRAADGTLAWSMDLGREQLQTAPMPLPR